MENSKTVLTIKEVAKFLGVHPMTVYKFAKEGKIPAFKIGSDWRFHRKYIDGWIAQQMKITKSKTHDKRKRVK